MLLAGFIVGLMWRAKLVGEFGGSSSGPTGPSAASFPALRHKRLSSVTVICHVSDSNMLGTWCCRSQPPPRPPNHRMAAPNDEDYALQLHKQLNAIPLRTRRGQELGTQQSFDRSKQRDKAGKPRTKRTNSSSQEHPSSRKRRASDADDEHGHTSAHHRAVKREASESDHSHPSDDEQAAGRPKQQHERRIKPCDSRDSGARHGQQLMLAEQGALQLAHCTPSQSAAAVAAAATKRLVKEQQAHSSHVGPPQVVKVFYTGVRWGLSLQHSAVKTRALLAKALNDAFVGEILSVGEGECLTVVFLDASGSVAELGPTKWSAAKSASARWRALAKTAARIYVRGEEGHVPGT